MRNLSWLILYTVVVSCSSDVEWREYHGGPDRNHYSTLDQIDTSNVTQLEKAWEYHTGDSSAQMQTNPIIVHGVLYATTASQEVFALRAATGDEIWRFRLSGDAQWFNKSRGVVYWEDGNDRRILFTSGSFLYALDAENGQLITDFGDSGRVDLHEGLGPTAQQRFVASPTPGTVFKRSIIMPLHLSESAGGAPGYIQCFDIVTGKLKWVFRTMPRPGEFGYETWAPDNYLNTDVGGANNWSGMSVDRNREILYVPTGSAAFDFYGGNRKGDNLFANCLLALDVNTGKRIWHYQFVHHDVWDRDLPAPPNLVTIHRDGKAIDAVAQITKQGYVYVFDRETGQPVFPIDEVKVPVDGVEGETLSPTQPIPRLPKAYARTQLTEQDINPWAENRDELLARFRGYRTKTYDPPSKQGTLMFPGFDGGGEWGGASFDPETGYLYVNANQMAWVLQLKDAAKPEKSQAMSFGQRVYQKNCVTCHREDRKGNVPSGYPSLVDIERRRDRAYIETIIRGGKGMMPGFPQLSASEKTAVVDFLLGTEKMESGSGSDVEASHVPYEFVGYDKFLDKNGYPAITPPWGTLTAINLNTGEHVWQRTLGEFRELTKKGIPVTGTENYGGGIVTKGGLFFIAATRDSTFRAFDKRTGKLLWETILPTSSFATPSTYEVDGVQYIALAVGGTKLGMKKGDSYIAFRLPKKH